MKTDKLIARYAEIGHRIFEHDDRQGAINDMVEFSRKLKQLPKNELEDFLLELHGTMFGSNPDDTREERLVEMRSTIWNFYPWWTGLGAETL